MIHCGSSTSFHRRDSVHNHTEMRTAKICGVYTSVCNCENYLISHIRSWEQEHQDWQIQDTNNKQKPYHSPAIALNPPHGKKITKKQQAKKMSFCFPLGAKKIVLSFRFRSRSWTIKVGNRALFKVVIGQKKGKRTFPTYLFICKQNMGTDGTDPSALNLKQKSGRAP